MLVIADYVLVLKNRDYIFFRYRKNIRIKRNINVDRIIEDLINGMLQNTEELLNKFTFLNYLIKIGYIKIKDNIISDNYNSRTLYYLSQYDKNPINLMKKLESITVCIVGLGGIGGSILQILCGNGIKNFVLIDSDKVESSNFNRQLLYSINDIGKFKVDVCKEYLSNRLNCFTCSTYSEFINSKEQLSLLLKNIDIDYLICAADKPTPIIQDICYRFAKQKNAMYIRGGVGVNSGCYTHSAFPIIQNNIKDEVVIKNIDTTYGSFGPTNMIISSFMAEEIIKNIIIPNSYNENKTIALDFIEPCVYNISKQYE